MIITDRGEGQMVEKFTDKTFTGASVELDNHEFRNCTFRDCKLVYAGGPPPTLDTCDFGNSQFNFHGPAANTIAFLKAMTTPRSGMQLLVREIFPALYGH
jgi:hypothetical protein